MASEDKDKKAKKSITKKIKNLFKGRKKPSKIDSNPIENFQSFGEYDHNFETIIEDKTGILERFGGIALESDLKAFRKESVVTNLIEKPVIKESYIHSPLLPKKKDGLIPQEQEESDENDYPPIEFNFLSKEQQEAIDNLSRKSNHTGGSKKSLIQEIDQKSNSSLSNKSSKLSGPLKKFCIEQAGTSLFILGIESDEDKQFFKDVLKQCKTQPDRVLEVPEQGEIQLQLLMLSNSTCSEIYRFLRDRGAKSKKEYMEIKSRTASRY